MRQTWSLIHKAVSRERERGPGQRRMHKKNEQSKANNVELENQVMASK